MTENNTKSEQKSSRAALGTKMVKTDALNIMILFGLFIGEPTRTDDIKKKAQEIMSEPQASSKPTP